MNEPERRAVDEQQSRPERASAPGEVSVAMLFAAIGRVARFGGELVALEAREFKQGARRVAKFHKATWMCTLTAWLALNAALASLAYTYLAIDPGIALLLITALNAVLAGLAHWLRAMRLKDLTRSPLLGLLERRF